MTRAHTYGQAGTALAQARAASCIADGIGAREAAELVRVSRATIAKAWRSGELPMLDIRDNDPKFDPEAVKAWARRKRLIA